MSLDTPPLDDPSFDINADQRGRLIGCFTSFIVLTTIVVVLRLLSRKLARAGFWWDDHFSVIAWVFSTFGCVLLLIELQHGYGRHIYIWGPIEGPLKVRQWRKILYVFELFFHTSTTLAKYSMLPMPLLWRLRTTARQQIILTIIFTLAGFVVLVSIIWVVVLAQLEASDVTWNFINAGIWSSLEPSMAVICACIPSLRPLFSLAARYLRNSSIPAFSSPQAGAKLTGSSNSGTGRRPWPGSSRGKTSDGMFSQLEEGGSDDMKPLGHDVSVQGGGEGEEGVELPQMGIQVKTEVRISTDKLEYRDRLF
ncbi:MAG: hypothetical protein Q9178_004811 [Gyalolechia marmorata]